jgi:uncharacterized membrane protein YdbT with pleckstrin-like domain
MDEFGKMALREHEAMRIARRQWFWMHFTVWVAFSIFMFFVWLLTTRGWPWFLIPVLAWGIVVAAHWAYAYVVRDPEEILMLRELRDRGAEERPPGAGKGVEKDDGEEPS